MDAIWDYTAAQWSETQADDYYLKLRDKFVSIATNPSSGAPVEVRADLRKMPAGSHIIYYRVTDGTVQIYRVLH